MIATLLEKLGYGILVIATAISGWLGAVPEKDFGVSLPGGEAVFETSLQERMSSTDTSMTLVSNSLRGGGSLSGYNCFTIDEGRSDAEYACGTVSGTTVSGLERGIDPANGTSTVASLKFAHRVGANVKITDFPLIQRLRNLSNGIEGYPNLLKYGTTTEDCGALTADDVICDKEYIDAQVSAGASNANTTTKGLVEIATDAENAAGTGTGGTGAILVIPSSSANSTATANKIPVANGSGKLAQGWLDLTENFNISGLFTSSGATTTISSATTTISNSVGVLGIGTTTPSTKQGGISVSKNAYFAQGVGVGHATTTSSPNLQVNGNLIVTQNASTTRLSVGQCSGCISGYETVTQAGALNGGSPATGSATASCSAGKVVVGGGVDGVDTNNSYGITSSFPSGSTGWTASFVGPNSDTGAFTVYAICVNQ